FILPCFFQTKFILPCFFQTKFILPCFFQTKFILPCFFQTKLYFAMTLFLGMRPRLPTIHFILLSTGWAVAHDCYINEVSSYVCPPYLAFRINNFLCNY
ncbi:MAG: hypothetical protein DRR00_33745, partial [Candidatus Parabeggiatoa sp. nov. 3]